MGWIAYRDYSDAKLLEQSEWTNDPGQLQQFIDGVVCSGGGDGEEAVERALLEGRREHDKTPISRMLLIGDAPPHWEVRGQKLTCHNHVLETDYMAEAAELGARGVPVFCFTLGSCSQTKSYFAAIASQTGGTVTELTASSLINTVCTSVLEDMGGAELVAEYHKRYG